MKVVRNIKAKRGWFVLNGCCFSFCFVLLGCFLFWSERCVLQCLRPSSDVELLLSVNWGEGGGRCIFIYSCSARRISFEISCF